MVNHLDADEIALALGGRKSGKSWVAKCPAHDDNMPSLSISESSDGRRVLFYCHAGCDQRSVMLALVRRSLWGPCDGI